MSTVTGEISAAFSDAAANITKPVEDAVERLLRAWEAGKINTAELQNALTNTIAVGNGYARGLASLLASAIIGDVLGVDPPIPARRIPPGLTPESEADRLYKAAGTLVAALDVGADIHARAARLAAAEALAAMQQQLVADYAAHGFDGWIRGLEADACPLCTDWADNGKVQPADMTMFHHPGCKCVPVPAKEG